MTNDSTFSLEQKEYLSGFFAGAAQRVPSPVLGRDGSGRYTDDVAAETVETVYGTPLEDLCKEERIKHDKAGLDCYEDIAAAAARGEMPQAPEDIFRFKFYGLFNVLPAQEGLMLRCRIAGGVMRDYQLEGLARMAEDWAGGYAHITTRANFQLREIPPQHAVDVLEGLVDLGFTSRGAGADNLRNITGSPTAGFDPEEIYDVQPLAKAMHHLILNTREFYELPRKFNISFDGGGAISVCADTNDIAFYAVRVGEGQPVEPGVYFRVQLSGITGHKQFARDCGILIRPEQCLAVAAAMIRVFVENGDRTKRGKARLKYLIDKWGDQRFVEATAEKLAFDLPHHPLEICEPRAPVVQQGHLGVHPQRQEGFCYVGLSVPVGRMEPDLMRAVAALSRKYGRGELRLTVWQNILIPHVDADAVAALRGELEALGVAVDPDPIRGGLVACTGSFGCKYAAADTKANALELGDYLAERHSLDKPLNIHLTGCPHSCAQHYIGDIGLQAVTVKTDGVAEEGYNIVLGGGVDDQQQIAKEIFKAVPFRKVKPLLSETLSIYENEREGAESFSQFVRRHSEEALQEKFAALV